MHATDRRQGRHWCSFVVGLAIATVGGVAAAQVAQPGQAAADKADEKKAGEGAEQSGTTAPEGTADQSGSQEAGTAPAQPPPAPAGKYDTVVVGPVTSDAPVGKYRQARWTTRRRFPTTRVYVRPEGDVEVEWWLETKLRLDEDADPRYRQQYELEFGLGHRLQLDLYLGTQQFGEGPMELYQQKVELRYAFADWDEIPTNPTVYLEWVRQNDAPYKGEAKALFGGSLKPQWFWGLNLVWEREFGGEYEHEYALTAGVARTVVEEQLSLGLEAKFESVDVRGNRLGFDAYEFLAGPSLQWMPSADIHIDLVLPLGFEVEDDDTAIILEPLIVIGTEL